MTTEHNKNMNIAIIGCSNIARRFARAAQAHNHITLYGVAARNMDKVNAFAEEFGIEHRYEKIDAVLADPQVDGVYIALPHILHAQASIAALSHHKAVLCEKPAVIHPREMTAIMQASYDNNTLFMEAMKTRYEPAYRKVKEIVDAGQIGEVESVDIWMCSDFGESLQDESRYFNQPKQGGALLDGGCYALNYFMDFLPRSYELESIGVRLNPELTADLHSESFLDFAGRRGYLESAIDTDKEKKAVITGTKGSLTIPTLHRPVQFTWKHEDGSETVHDYPYDVDDMFPEIDAFYTSWKDGLLSDPIMSQEESYAQARLMQRLRGDIFGFDPDDHYPDVDEPEDDEEFEFLELLPDLKA